MEQNASQNEQHDAGQSNEQTGGQNTQLKKTAFQTIAESVDNTFNEVQIGVIKRTVAKGTDNHELAYFLYTAKSVGLNPLNREIWCYKDHRGNLIVFAGRDGFLKKAQQDQRWNGIVSSEVCVNDEFVVDIPNGKITHKPSFLTDRGRIVGAYCYIRPKNAEIATIEWVDFKTYNRGGGKYKNSWDTHPADMIKKVAETHALKKAFGISGLQSEHDFNIVNDVAEPVDTTRDNEIEQKKHDLSIALDSVQDEQMKQQIIDRITKHENDGTNTADVYQREIDRIMQNVEPQNDNENG